VYRGGTALTDLTSAARTPGNGDVAFPRLGESLYLGYPEKFREIHPQLASGAGQGWNAVLEYPVAVDANGKPTQWATLAPLGNSTGQWSRSGSVVFDPPLDWKTASIGNRTARHYYVRLRTTADGVAPVAISILGRDYVGAGNSTSGTVPVFDAAADADRDGYLNDAEYARRASGKNARFLYESRLFHMGYGQMRFAANPASSPFRDWAIDYHTRFLAGQPLADGLFVDNSGGKVPVPASQVMESVFSYAQDHAAMLAAVARALAPQWLLANTAGGATAADPVVKQGIPYFEEFAIRPLAHHYSQFEDLAAQVARRNALRSPETYAILDSYPTGGSPTDGRTQLATLAYYYLLADPESTFLMFYGGFEPATSWTRHWSPAAAYDVGQPTGSWSLFASGTDPSDARLGYRVYARSFDNALVLYKPLSYTPGHGAGTLADVTATLHVLGGNYQVLRSDGTLGPTVNSVSLRNGEGMILIKVK
jgi:hypothetical protein